MNIKHFIAKSISQTVSVFSSGKPEPGLRILAYHAIGTRALNDPGGIFSIDPAAFREQIAFLAGYSDVVPADFKEGSQDMSSFKTAVTFDDGYRDNLTEAVPVLEQYNLPYTVFIAAGHIKNSRAGFLSSEEVKTLAGLKGASIGSHADSHKKLTECSDAELENELAGSRRYLEDLTGCAVTQLAYPYGAVDKRVVDAAKKAGYETAVCSHFGINRTGIDFYRLKRTEIRGDDTLKTFKLKLRGAWDWYGRLKT